MAFSLSFLPKSFLGIDIGTSAIKVVEISGWGSRRTLKNYGLVESANLYEQPFRTFEQNTLLLSSQQVVKAIRGITEETEMKSKEALFALPDFATFFTNFELPSMTQEELAEGVKYEARRHVPVPLSEISYDWQVVKEPKDEHDTYEILLVAVPNEVIGQYQGIAKGTGFALGTLEAEVFSLLRSCVGKEDKRVMLLDIGAQTTTLSFVTDRKIRSSHSFEVAGNSFSERIATSLSIEYAEAEQMKKKEGTHIRSGNTQILIPLLDQIIWEMRKILQSFEEQEPQPIQKILLAGGSSRMPGLKEYFEEQFPKIIGDQTESGRGRVEIVRPFHQLFYPPILEETLSEMGPSYAVAIGSVLRGFTLH